MREMGLAVSLKCLCAACRTTYSSLISAWRCWATPMRANQHCWVRVINAFYLDIHKD